jgi:hypothetical protein
MPCLPPRRGSATCRSWVTTVCLLRIDWRQPSAHHPCLSVCMQHGHRVDRLHKLIGGEPTSLVPLSCPKRTCHCMSPQQPPGKFQLFLALNVGVPSAKGVSFASRLLRPCCLAPVRAATAGLPAQDSLTSLRLHPPTSTPKSHLRTPHLEPTSQLHYPPSP